MLQQTQVSRVELFYARFVERWPTLQHLAKARPAQVRAQWEGLGYYRRAANLHALAKVVVKEHGGEMPDHPGELRALPGIGPYTAGAVACFAFERRTPAVDTNVARVIRRAFHPRRPKDPNDPVIWQTAEALLPRTGKSAWAFNQGIMELGALVCTARTPNCAQCPLIDRCAWQRADAPPYAGPRVRPQRFAGTDRQVRGLLMDVLRDSPAPVGKPALDLAWPDRVQRDRALDGLVADGLVDPLPDGRYALPA
jgi:A/G-specific adenine glycosylase